VSLVVDEHRHYLSDVVRLDAFRAAIHQAVRPGDVVVDLASGTGILGLFACQAGASRVYSIEATGMIEIARAVAAANNVSDRVLFVHGMSTEVALPERVDVIVCDQIGNFGFEAGLIQYGADARERFLRPGGRFVPGRVDLFVAALESPPLHAQVAFWSGKPAGFDFGPVQAWAGNTGYPTMIAAEMLLGAGRPIVSFDAEGMGPGQLTGQVDLPVDRSGTLHGLAGWFEATLAGDVVLSSAPTAPARVQRRNVFLPIDEPIDVQRGDVVRVRLHAIPFETVVTWTVEVVRSGLAVGRARQSTLHGMLIDRESLRRTDPRFVPTLTPRGRARLSVLELCDGTRPLAEIEREMLARHPDLFPALPAAAAFVVEVVAGYSNP
jgi:protein arginine N-methyltransferase 1